MHLYKLNKALEVGSQHMKTLGVAAGISAVLGFSPAVAAQEVFDRGQALYENHCRECHESWAHSRDGRHVTTLDGLRQRVAAWSIHSSLNWNQQEIDDVADYLNRHFYQFSNKP